MSLLLGFSRALVPPMAEPAGQQAAPKTATTNLGLDRDRIQAIYADQRVQQAQTKAEAAGSEVGGSEAHASAAKVQQLQEGGRLDELPPPDALDQVQLIDPLMVTRMKEIYRDRLTLSGAWFGYDGGVVAKGR